MRLALSALAALASVALPVLAHAATMDDFSVTGHGLDLAFSLPSSPAVGNDYVNGLFFYLGNVSFTENGTQKTASDVYFFTKADLGGFELADKFGLPIDNLNFTGPQLFTGGLKTPTFTEGTFAVQPQVCFGTAAQCTYNLTIAPSTSPVPEPGSLALLGTGALGVVGAVRRRMSL